MASDTTAETAAAFNITGVTPYIAVSDASAAVEFYKRAFGATEDTRMPADDGKRVMHCMLSINGGRLMLNDFFPERGYPYEKPQAFVLHLQVDNADTWWRRAVDAGAEVVMRLEKQFWGDYYGQVRDPYGVVWSIGSANGPA